MFHPRLIAAISILLMLGASCAGAQTPPASPPTTAPTTKPDFLKHIQFDAKKKIIRVDCEVCRPDYDVDLEFFCVSSGGNEYESVLRTDAKPSGLNFALLALGLQPGAPVKYVQATNQWLAPHGPPLEMTCEFEKGGKQYVVPANRVMRNNKTKKEVEPMTWIYTGSKVMEDGRYGADEAGYLISVLNNELSVIDIPVLAGRSTNTREWELNTDLLPPPGSKVTLVIEPAGKVIDPKFANPAALAPGQPAAGLGDTTTPDDPIRTRLETAEKAGAPVVKVTMDADGKLALNGQPVSVQELTDKLKEMKSRGKMQVWFLYDATSEYDQAKKVIQSLITAGIDLSPDRVGIGSTEQNQPADIASAEAKVKVLEDQWKKTVAPQQTAIRQAAEAHYKIIEALRREQNRMIDEANRIQRSIDELNKEYDGITTPHPQNDGQ